jgi:peptide/nickel transport system ATP-binding protein
VEVADLHTHIRQRKRDVRAVDGVSFTINAGETLGLVGESGCGKSMTAMSMLKLLPPGARITSGSVRFEGRELVNLDESEMQSIRGNDMAIVFQDQLTALNPTKTIGNQVAEVLQIHRGWDRKRSLARAEEILGLVEMPQPRERVTQYPHQLSGGLRQRSLIAMALACEPKLLIADEPTTALDVTIQAQIFDLLDSLKRELKMAILLITHDLGVIARWAERVCVMYAGRIVEEANVDELFELPRHRYTEALLRAVPRTDLDKNVPLAGISGSPPDLAALPAGCHFHPRCKSATERCTECEPKFTVIGNHGYACHHPCADQSSTSMGT